MFARMTLIGVLLAGLFAADGSRAAPYLGCPEPGGSISEATYQGISSFAPDYSSMQCVSQECVAARDVYCALRAQLGQLMPGGHIWLSEAGRRRAERTHDRILRAFGTTHRERRPLYCAILASIAAHTTGNVEHDGPAVDYIVRLFLLFRLAPPGCGARIRAAFPQVAAIQQELAQYWDVCLADPRQCQPAFPQPRRRRKPW